MDLKEHFSLVFGKNEPLGFFFKANDGYFGFVKSTTGESRHVTFS